MLKGKPTVYKTVLCDQEGCSEPVCFEIWDDDGPVRDECEQHATATVENSNGELRLKDPRFNVVSSSSSAGESLEAQVESIKRCYEDELRKLGILSSENSGETSGDSGE
jgi:hypothetical protein